MADKAKLLPALGAGFGLLVREPVSVLIWGVIYIALTIGPFLLFIPFMGAGFVDYFRDISAAAAAGTPPPRPIFAALLPLLQLLQIVTGLLAASMIYAAIYRAVLRPAERGFAYLRLSSEEFNLGVVIVVLYVLMLVAMFGGIIALMIPVGIIVAVGGQGGGAATAVIALIVSLLVVAALVAAIVPAVRLGMALPMTIAERRIRIFEAWTFTRGYSWRLLGLALMQILIILGVYIVVGGAAFTAVAGNVGSLENLSSGGMAALAPLLIFAGVIWLLVVFIFTPIMIAPWARAYELIAAARGEDNNTVFD